MSDNARTYVRSRCHDCEANGGLEFTSSNDIKVKCILLGSVWPREDCVENQKETVRVVRKLELR